MFSFSGDVAQGGGRGRISSVKLIKSPQPYISTATLKLFTFCLKLEVLGERRSRKKGVGRCNVDRNMAPGVDGITAPQQC